MSGFTQVAPDGQPECAQPGKGRDGVTARSELGLPELVGLLQARICRWHLRCIAISGPPGSGKTTLARGLREALERSGTPALWLSLDDYYLGRSERQALARRIHPLFERRGVPGTHDWDLCMSHLGRLLAGEIAGIRLPRFDKAQDERLPSTDWLAPGKAPRVVLFEGWCLGATAQAAGQLADPVNELESGRDPDRAWRAAVNRYIERYSRDVAKACQEIWYLDVPDWHRVVDWRWQQEQALDPPRLKSRAEVADFLATFERVARHMQLTHAAWSSLALRADATHRFTLTHCPDDSGAHPSPTPETSAQGCP